MTARPTAIGDPAPIGRAAAARDAPAVASCLAGAFHDDPVWGRWTFPDPSTRHERLCSLMGFWVRGGVRHPWLRMTDRAEAVALWVPPGELEMSAAEERELAAFLERVLGQRASEVLALLAEFDAHHPHDQPHYYLSLWGTSPDHAGRGIGTALLHECLAEIDAQALPAYLESTNAANIARYEQLGFQARAEFGPPAGPSITTMWRAGR